MRQFQFISAHYNTDKSISLYASDSQKTHKLKVIGFQPYFYVPDTDEIPDLPEITNIEEGFTHEDGFPVKKVTVTSPDVVHGRKISIRDNFTSHYEADVRFIRRFLIDTNIHNSFALINDSNLNRPIHYTELVPTDFEPEPTIAYLDVEIQAQTRFPDPYKPECPVTCWTIYNSKTGEYLTAILAKKEKIVVNSLESLVYCATEQDLLNLLSQTLEDIQPSVIAHWNGKIADIEYPYWRAQRFGIKIPFHHSDNIDLCLAYRHLHKRLYNNLKTVATEENIFTPEQLVSDHYRKDMYEKDPEKFIAYNKMDVQIMVKLDREGWTYTTENEKKEKVVVHEPARELCKFFWDLRNSVGVEDCRSAFHNSVLIDTLMLRKAYGKTVLNSGHPKIDFEYGDEETGYSGATVFDPIEGILPENPEEVISVLDMSRYYPNIILAYHIDDLGCRVVIDLMNKRNEIETKMKVTILNSPEYKMWEKKRDVIKFLLNSTYGYFGSSWVRKFKKEKAEKTTSKGRLGLQILKDAVESKTPELLSKLNDAFQLPEKFTKGFTVVFGDTDSVGIAIKPHLIGKLVWYLNEIVLKEHCKNELIPPLLKLEHEKSASKGIFVKSKTSNRAAKKRRAQRIIWQKGRECDYIEVKGFDYVRGNSSKITRVLQMKLITEILKGDKNSLPAFIRNLIKDVKNNKYSIDELAIPVTLSKPLEAYIKTKPDYVRGSLWSIEHLGLEIIGGDRIKMIYCLNGHPYDVVCYFDEETITKRVGPPEFILDYTKIIDRTIKKKSEQFLNLANIPWSQVEGYANLKEMFNF